jgi:hypothetical protein
MFESTSMGRTVGTVDVDLLEKVQKLGGPVAFVAFSDHKTGGDIKRGKPRSLPWRK